MRFYINELTRLKKEFILLRLKFSFFSTACFTNGIFSTASSSVAVKEAKHEFYFVPEKSCLINFQNEKFKILLKKKLSKDERGGLKICQGCSMARNIAKFEDDTRVVF